jgi:hypothetical protein
MSNRKGRTALMHVYTPIIQSSNYVYSQGDKVDVGIDKFGDEVRVGSVVISAVGGRVETYLVKEIKTAGGGGFRFRLSSYKEPDNPKKSISRYSGDVLAVGEGKIVAAKLRDHSFY